MASAKEISAKEVEEFLPMVRFWARHYSHRRQHILDYEDLVVVGLMGLMDAARRYNPRRDVLFKTYAEFRVRGEIIDELRRHDWLSRSERRKQKTYLAAQHQLEQDLGRSPTRHELARVLPFKPRELDRMHQYSTHELLHNYQESDVSAVEVARDTVAESIIARDEIQELLKSLPEIHRRVMERRYFDDAPLSDIAQEIGLSEGRVSQLHGEAILMLRKSVSAA